MSSQDDSEEWCQLEESGSESEESTSITIQDDLENTESDLQLAWKLAEEEFDSTKWEDEENEDLQLAISMSLQNKAKSQDDGESSCIQTGDDLIRWTGFMTPGSLFAAQWQIRIPDVDESHLRLETWGDRIFLHNDCNGDCIHRRVLQMQDRMHTLLGPRYSITASNLRAPVECGQWSERWRLRDTAGCLVGPILEIRVHVHNETVSTTSTRPINCTSRKGKEREIPSEQEATIIFHRPFRQVDEQDAFSVNEPFQYVWQLLNSGKIAWRAPFSLSRIVEPGVKTTNSPEKPRFAITNLAKKIVTGPIHPAMMINLTLSGIYSPNISGLHEEVWMLNSASTDKALIKTLPLRIRVVQDNQDVTATPTAYSD